MEFNRNIILDYVSKYRPSTKLKENSNYIVQLDRMAVLDHNKTQ